jgi:hypothetical protein
MESEMKKLPWLKGRQDSRNELEELLNQPPSDPEFRQLRVWLKTEQNLYGRDHKGGFRDWLEETFGPIDNADESWLTPTTERSSG